MWGCGTGLSKWRGMEELLKVDGDLGNLNNRILIDACIPYERKVGDKFPPIVDVSPELRAKLKAK